MTLSTTIKLAGVEVPRIGLGTNRLRDSAEHHDFIRAATDAGIRHIDTAHLYTDGESEAAIGAVNSALPDGSVVATKGGYGGAGRGRPEALRAEIEASLRSLQTDVIDLYYLHRVDPETPLEESLGAIAQERDAGRIRHVGISEVSVEEIERARGVVEIAAVQNHYNFSERRHDAVVDHCEAQGIVFVPFFPLRDGGEGLAEVARRHDVSERQAALAWLLRRSPVMLPIPGTLSVEHVRENLAALELELTAEDLAAL
jgi:aryl-alcohol dehydrogenase-like predicted oxidoreductase